MATNEYHLSSEWRIAATQQEVYDIVSDAAALAEWWPSGFLRVDVLEPGDDSGLGKRLAVITKGLLPYTLNWQQLVVAVEEPNGFAIRVEGDFVGRGEWSFQQEGPRCIARFDWRIDARKTILRYGSPVLKPIFAWNHRWVMERGRQSLELEVRRRRARTESERAAIPAPPGPAWPHRRRRREATPVETRLA